jgi:hypothetical protein
VSPGSALLVAFTLLQTPAPPQAELSLVLACGGQPSELTLTIHNSGQVDTAALIGIAFANGLSYLPRELIVELKRSGNPEVEQLRYQGPTAIAGRMDHWVVALPVGAKFTLTLRATDFISTSTARAVTPPEELRVRLTGRPITSDLNVDMTGMKTWRMWAGSASSNAVRPLDCPR